MINLTINGQAIEAPEGSTVLQAARQAGIHIPTLCDHPALKPYGGCRLCVVEVEGSRALMASCTLPVHNGMVVRTTTPKLSAAREFILTLLFSERNHFCMYCQKSGGDCELQNAAYAEDMTHWPLPPTWKTFEVDASHPYYVIDHSRCILCRRCVRACGELVGNFTLNIENRGARSMLTADYGVPAGESSCIRCGTCVQSCPTGALIDRQSAYLGQEKTTQAVQSICVGCSVGCGTTLHVRNNRLVRIDGDWDAPVNGGLLCELGRYQSKNDERPRLTTPLVRKDGVLKAVDWEEALQTIVDTLSSVNGKSGGASLAALASTRLPAEALYGFKALFEKHLKAALVTTTEEHLTTSLAVDPSLEGNLESLKRSDCVLVVGADLVSSHQVAGFMVKRNLPRGTTLIVIDPYENEMAPLATYSLHPRPGTDALVLEGIMTGLRSLGMDKSNGSDQPGLSTATLQDASAASGIPAEVLVEISRALGAALKPVIVYGKGVTQEAASPTGKAIEGLAHMLGGAALLNPKGKANSSAAQAYKLDRPFVRQPYQAVFLALGDDMPTPRLLQYLEGVKFLAVQASHASSLTESADVVLPVEAWPEQDGHYVNLEGRLQAAHKALEAPPNVWSNEAVLEALAGRLGLFIDSGWQAALESQLAVALI
jgi:formate dehydrogenase major subunit